MKQTNFEEAQADFISSIEGILERDYGIRRDDFVDERSLVDMSIVENTFGGLDDEEDSTYNSRVYIGPNHLEVSLTKGIDIHGAGYALFEVCKGRRHLMIGIRENKLEIESTYECSEMGELERSAMAVIRKDAEEQARYMTEEQSMRDYRASPSSRANREVLDIVDECKKHPLLSQYEGRRYMGMGGVRDDFLAALSTYLRASAYTVGLQRIRPKELD